MSIFPFIRLFPSDLNIDFLGLRRFTMVISMVLIAAAVSLVATRGLNYGIDFQGGVEVAVRYQQPADIEAVRQSIASLNAGDAAVQQFGEVTDVLVRVEAPAAATAKEQSDAALALRKDIQATLVALQPGAVLADSASTTDNDNVVELLSDNFVGSAISGELFQAGMIAIALALTGVAIYIWFRFEWQFAISALAALLHDVLTTIGLFALLQIEFNLYTTAAILTIAGYSINDTVVVFDRSREELRRYKETPIVDVLNKAINGTLTRTIMTSITTLLAVVALAVFGGPIIRGLAIALIWGVVIGTYSSIFFATPLLTLFNLRNDVFEKKDAANDEDFAAAWAATQKDDEEEEIRRKVREREGQAE